MKFTNLLLASAAISTLALTGCQNIEENSTWGNGNSPTFTSYIKGQKASKASGTAWADGDKVGIFMKSTGVESFSTSISANAQYIADAKGNLTAASAADAITYPETGNSDFVAYYPYSASTEGTTVAVNVQDQSDLTAIDLLYSNNASNQSTSAGTVNLGFSHKLSAITLNITADASIATTAGLTVTLSGVPVTANFNLDDASLTTTSTGNIALQANAAGTQATGIVIPTATAGATLVFTLGDLTKEVQLSAAGLAALAQGYSYAIPVALTGGSSAGTINVSFGQATIADWTTQAGETITVDFGAGTSENPDDQGGDQGETGDDTGDDQGQIGGDGSGEEVVIFEETFGESVEKNGNYWPGIESFTGYTSGLTISDPVMTANGWSYSNISIRTTSTLTSPHAWFAANKDAQLLISGFSTSGYTTCKLTYDITANADGATVNMIPVYCGDTQIDVPATAIETKNVFQSVTIEGITPGFTSLYFLDSSANTAGMRIDNIKLIGVK